MGLFNSGNEAVLAEIQGLRKQVAELKGEKEGHRETLTLLDQIKVLKKELVDLEIQRDKQKETHEREQRELKHMIGLEKKRQEFEVTSAKRETTVTIREENLNADRKRFEQQMDFTTKRFEKEVGYLKDIMGQVLDRLPTVNVDRSISTKEAVAK
jgi:hypothetical protein